MMKQQLFATIIFATIIATVTSNTQSVAISGNANCDGFYPILRIELWDKDRLDPDDLMANSTTGKNGKFYIQGKESEITTIDPELRIFHKCVDPSVKCYRQTIIEIPDDYITDGEEPKKIYEAGNINLKVLPNTESKYCN